MTAEPGAPMREVRYEETTWKARPDWARDGRRVVYCVLPRPPVAPALARAPPTAATRSRSPTASSTRRRRAGRRDGTRIAYVSNEGGNTVALWTIDVPGGERRRSTVRERRYIGPIGRLRIDVVDAADGAPVPARVSVTAADGRASRPSDAWRHADDDFDRARAGQLEYALLPHGRRDDVTVPAGPRDASRSARGLEYAAGRARSSTCAEAGTRDVAVSRSSAWPTCPRAGGGAATCTCT